MAPSVFVTCVSSIHYPCFNNEVIELIYGRLGFLVPRRSSVERTTLKSPHMTYGHCCWVPKLSRASHNLLFYVFEHLACTKDARNFRSPWVNSTLQHCSAFVILVTSSPRLQKSHIFPYALQLDKTQDMVKNKLSDPTKLKSIIGSNIETMSTLRLFISCLNLFLVGEFPIPPMFQYRMLII